MDTIKTIIEWFINFVLHMDKELPIIISAIGGWTYLALFGVIFVETGVVIFPFLPGDSLLFAAGTISALQGAKLSPILLHVLLFSAALIGDNSNYWIGHFIGPKVFTTNSRWVKREYLDRTQAFYAKYGRKTVFLARFVPIVRTFSPFVAGVGQMNYRYFLSIDTLGAFVWTGLFIWGGFLLASVEWIQSHFSLVTIFIVMISLIPMLVEVIKSRMERRTKTAALAKSE